MFEVKHDTARLVDIIGIFPPGHPENDVPSTWCVEETVLLTLNECGHRIH